MHIHLIDLRAAALPIPPASEQELILELLPKLLGPVQTLEATLDALSEQLGAVERNCLSKAFRGHLLSAS